MIKKWKLNNFKSVQQADLCLSPLTLFAGANSSGKSTFLQSILLISQTMGSSVGSQTVLLNGHLAKLGQFDDLKTAFSDSDSIRIAWELSVGSAATDPVYSSRWYSSRLDVISCDLTFGVPRKNDSKLLQLNPKLFSSLLTCMLRPTEGETTLSQQFVRLTLKDPAASESDINESDKARRINPWTFDLDFELDDASLEELREEISSPVVRGCTLQHFLPGWFLVTFDSKSETIKALIASLGQLRSRVTRFLPSADIRLPSDITNFLNERRADLGRPALEPSDENNSNTLAETVEWLRGTPTKYRLKAQSVSKGLIDLARRTIPEKEAITPIEPPAVFREAGERLTSFFSRNVRYLGPLRDEPRPLYPLQETVDPQDIGLHGEHTAAVFHRFQHLDVSYLPSSSFTSEGIDRIPVTASLSQAVFDWLAYLDVAKRVVTRDEGKFGHALTVFMHDSDVEHDLTHVGVGVSQVLPIVVMCLISSPETTLILEQPELHLNPKVQTRLADFFLSMSLSNKQCLIETHSEYLINRLRYRIAVAPNKSLSSLLTLYFVEKDRDETTYRPVVINEYGSIANWPTGFFDQSQREIEDILLAASKKARAEISKQT
jgi:predicted ATPase